MIGTASAAAFATGGSTINQLLGIPYWLCTLLIAAFIFVIALFGTHLVRKVASTLSVLIICGLLLVLIPNICVQFPSIIDNIGKMMQGHTSVLASTNPSFLELYGWPFFISFFSCRPFLSCINIWRMSIQLKKLIVRQS